MLVLVGYCEFLQAKNVRRTWPTGTPKRSVRAAQQTSQLFPVIKPDAQSLHLLAQSIKTSLERMQQSLNAIDKNLQVGPANMPLAVVLGDIQQKMGSLNNPSDLLGKIVAVVGGLFGGQTTTHNEPRADCSAAIVAVVERVGVIIKDLLGDKLGDFLACMDDVVCPNRSRKEKADERSEQERFDQLWGRLVLKVRLAVHQKNLSE